MKILGVVYWETTDLVRGLTSCPATSSMMLQNVGNYQGLPTFSYR